jgi:hypothetical protein
VAVVESRVGASVRTPRLPRAVPEPAVTASCAPSGIRIRWLSRQAFTTCAISRPSVVLPRRPRASGATSPARTSGFAGCMR